MDRLTNTSGVALRPDVDTVSRELYLDTRMERSRVILIKGKGVFGPGGDMDRLKISEMLSLGFRNLIGARETGEGLARLFARDARIGIKINTIGGRKISTRPELSLSLAELLIKNGRPDRNIVIWARPKRAL